VLELYFLIYRVPKMMTKLARERGRSAWKWSLLGIGVWLGVEFAVMIIAGVVYGIGEIILKWPEPMDSGYRLISYLLALVTAMVSVTFLSRYLTRIPREESLPVPPPPPEFTPGV
jgi:hypothetical protein